MNVTVHGTYLTPDGAPCTGAVRFTLRPAATTVDGKQITEGPITCTLDRTGSFSQVLTPDPDLVVSGAAVYVVHERVTGLVRTWNLYLDGTNPVNVPALYPGTDWEWAVVTPIPGPPGPAGGPPGPPGVAGTRGSLWWTDEGAPQITSGVLAQDMYLDVLTGDVWVYEGSGTVPAQGYGMVPYGTGPYGG